MLGYLVLMAQPTVFNTHCGTEFCYTNKFRHSSRHARPSSNERNFSELVRTHKHKIRLFKEYYAVDRAYKKVISKLILKNSTSYF